LTLGLYQHLVDVLHLTIATMPCVTPAQLSDNITVKDVARLFARDGITIPQISDAFEWGHWPYQDEVQEARPAGRWRPCRQ